VLALVAPLVVAYGRLLQLLLLIALVAITGAVTRYGLGRDLRSLKSGPTPGAVVGPTARPGPVADGHRPTGGHRAVKRRHRSPTINSCR
jgi:hypothetical protein